MGKIPILIHIFQLGGSTTNQPKGVSPDLVMILTGLLAKFCAQAVGWAKLVVTKLEKTIDAHEAVGWKDQVGNCFREWLGVVDVDVDFLILVA